MARRGCYVREARTLVSEALETLPELEAPRGALDCLSPDGSGGRGAENPGEEGQGAHGGISSPQRG